jgi:transposase
VAWFERYSQRVEEWRWPGAKGQQEEVMDQIGQDGSLLLIALWSELAPVRLRYLSEVQGLRRTWMQQFFQAGKGGCGCAVKMICHLLT